MSNNTPPVILISGVCTSRKSSIAEALAELDAENIFVTELETEECCESADPVSINISLSDARDNEKNGCATVIFGDFFPEEIKCVSNFDEDMKLYFGIIKLSSEELEERLVAKGIDRDTMELIQKRNSDLETAVRAEKNHFILDGDLNEIDEIAELILDLIEEL